MKTISVKQPYAYLICAGIKPIENRTWKCPEKYIGKRVLIHAALDKKLDLSVLTKEQYVYASLILSEKSMIPVIPVDKWNRGAIIGSVEIVDCVVNHPSIWAEKAQIEPTGWSCGLPVYEKPIYNWVLANAELFKEPILNVKGRLGLWDYPIGDKEKQCPEIPYFGSKK